jgi:putative transposase
LRLRTQADIVLSHVRLADFDVHCPRIYAGNESFPARRPFLGNHVKQLVSVDFFVVPSLSFRILYVFLVLAHDRRRMVRFNVTEHPTAEWTATQLLQAFPWDKGPRFLLRDRDSIYGAAFRAQAKCLEISEVLTAFRSPWQSPYVERLIGSIRRECLDHVIILNETSLRSQIGSYVDYYRRTRCHLSLEKDSPDGRAVQCPEMGKIIAIPKVGGLHHRYERRAALATPTIGKMRDYPMSH